MNSKHKCKECKEYFSSGLETWQVMNFGRFHDEDCSNAFALRTLKKTCAENRKKEKKEWAATKTKVKGIKHQEGLTQTAFNRYVRLRDAYNERNCISCDNPINYESTALGGACDAGHYKTQKGNPELRYNLWNVNAECKHCNHHDDEHLHGMKINIVKRFGKDRLDWLDGHHKLKNYTIEQHQKWRRILNKRAKRYL